MNEREFLTEMVRALEELGIRYFITGGMAAIAYGELRFTSDVDVAADLSLPDVPRFMARFPAQDYYLSEAAMRDAIVRRVVTHDCVHGELLMTSGRRSMDKRVSEPGREFPVAAPLGKRIRKSKAPAPFPMRAPFDFAEPGRIYRLQRSSAGSSIHQPVRRQ